MIVQKREVWEYKTPDGKFPFREWFHSLKDVQTQAIITTRLDRLEQGNLGNCESVGNGVFELKIYFGPGYRVYFGQEDHAVIILLGGGDKSTQSKDIDKAQAHWAYYRRNKDGTHTKLS